MNFQSIFELQAQLMDKYYDIENEVCGGLKYPRRLKDNSEFQCVHAQAHIRVMTTRILEELYEADQEVPGTEKHKVEIIDALHFFTELLLFCGISSGSVWLSMEQNSFDGFFNHYPVTPNQWAGCFYDVSLYDVSFYDVSYSLSGFNHNLKAKPWSHNHKVTDVDKLRIDLANAYLAMLRLVSRNMTYEECLSIYLGKHKVNTERQENGY